jgi:hypothetical protein
VPDARADLEAALSAADALLVSERVVRGGARAESQLNDADNRVTDGVSAWSEAAAGAALAKLREHARPALALLGAIDALEVVDGPHVRDLRACLDWLDLDEPKRAPESEAGRLAARVIECRRRIDTALGWA